MYASEGVQGGGRSKPGLILLDFWQTGPVDPDFFGQEPSLDCKDSFEPKSSFLDQMVQKLRAYKGLYVFPFPGLIYRYLDHCYVIESTWKSTSLSVWTRNLPAGYRHFLDLT